MNKKDNEKYSFSSECFEVSMRDIDLHGHVHNSVYLDYVEDAIVKKIKQQGLIAYFRPDSSGVIYHVKKAELIFISESRVDDIIRPIVILEKMGTKSLTFHVTLMNETTEKPSAECSIVWVCVDPVTKKAIPVPAETKQLLTDTF